MKRIVILIKVVIVFLLFFVCKSSNAQEKVSIIPKPLKIETSIGSMEINGYTKVLLKGGSIKLDDLAIYLTHSVEKQTGIRLETSGNSVFRNFIKLEQVNDSSLGNEGYKMEIKPEGITLSSSTSNGIFYGIQTLIQLSPVSKTTSFEVPALTIEDKPHFKWRGILLDCSRHFYSVETVKKFIDLMAMYKLNTMQWHLVDNPGWRIEIKKYPKLTEIGAWRVDRENEPWSENRTPAKEGEKATYGGFYTQAQIRDIVRYASDRAITIVPEIEMPSHVMSAIAAYPYLSCKQEHILVPTGAIWPITENYCAGNDSVFQFLEDVLTEVIDLFPSKYIHVGGDEANKTNWKTCPKCLARMKSEKLDSVDQLQSYFIKRIEKFIVSKGRKLIGWEEILEGGLAPEATVTSWTGINGGIEAAKLKHDVVMASCKFLYFDHYQANPKTEPVAPPQETYGLYVPLIKTYSFDPVPEQLNPEENIYILGVQACLWTEYIPTPEHLEYMAIPRIFAVSEIGWTMTKNKNWDDFLYRTNVNVLRIQKLGYNYCRTTLTAPITLSK